MSNSIMGTKVAAEMDKIINSDSHADMFYKKAEKSCDEKEVTKESSVDNIISSLVRISNVLERSGCEKSSKLALIATHTLISEANKKNEIMKKVSEMDDDDLKSIFDDVDVTTEMSKEEMEQGIEDLLDKPENIVVEEILDNTEFIADEEYPIEESLSDLLEPQNDEQLCMINQANKELDAWIKKNAEGLELDELFEDVSDEDPLSPDSSIEDLLQIEKPEEEVEESLEDVIDQIEQELQNEVDEAFPDLEKKDIDIVLDDE